MKLDASRKRTKKALQEVEEAFSSRRINAYLTGKMQGAKASVVIVDDMDMMTTGSADRGGVTQILAFSKTTKIPIVCICNDPNSRALKPIVAAAMHVRMQRPSVDGIANILVRIAVAEGVSLTQVQAKDIATRSGCDVRQAINDMQFSLGGSLRKAELSGTVIDRSCNPFDAAMALFGCQSKYQVTLGSKLFGSDPVIGPLLVHENYIKTGSRVGLSKLAEIADAISEGDALGSKTWNDDTRALLTCTIPCALGGAARLDGRVDFPVLLGRMSTMGKNYRLIADIKTRSKIGSISSATLGKREFALDLVPFSRAIVSVGLVTEGKKRAEISAIERAAGVLLGMGMNRGDWDSMVELSLAPSAILVSAATRTSLTKQMTRTTVTGRKRSRTDCASKLTHDPPSYKRPKISPYTPAPDGECEYECEDEDDEKTPEYGHHFD